MRDKFGYYREATPCHLSRELHWTNCRCHLYVGSIIQFVTTIWQCHISVLAPHQQGKVNLSKRVEQLVKIVWNQRGSWFFCFLLLNLKRGQKFNKGDSKMKSATRMTHVKWMFKILMFNCLWTCHASLIPWSLPSAQLCTSSWQAKTSCRASALFCPFCYFS